MIGLEYISRYLGYSYTDVANKLGVTPQTVNDWLKGKRKIPNERLKQLSGWLGIEEKYFQNSLNRVEEIEVQIQYLSNQSENEEDTLELMEIDERGKEQLLYLRTSPYKTDIQVLNNLKQKQILLLEIESLLYSQDSFNKDDVEKGEVYTKMFSQFTSILQNGEDKAIKALDLVLYVIANKESSPFEDANTNELRQLINNLNSSL